MFETVAEVMFISSNNVRNILYCILTYIRIYIYIYIIIYFFTCLKRLLSYVKLTCTDKPVQYSLEE